MTAARGPSAEFARLVRAWRHGGDTGVTTAREPLTPEPALMVAARGALDRALAEMDGTAAPPRLRSWRNRLTLDDAGLQLRLGPDGHWYPYAREDGEWWPCAPSAPDPVAAVTAVWDRRQSPGVA
nr:hypothetical protein OG409_13005 [Streptomyces sp. NBC_00974]